MPIKKKYITIANRTLIGLTGFSLIGLIGFSFYSGLRMNALYPPIIDAVMVIKQESTLARLKFKDFLRDNRHEKLETVWHHLDEADWYANAMLRGGKNDKGEFLALESFGLRLIFFDVQQKLDELRNLLRQRVDGLKSILPETETDRRYDIIFSEIMKKANRLEFRVQTMMAVDLNRFRIIQIVLLGACLILSLVLGVLLRRLSHLRAEELGLELGRILDNSSNEIYTFDANTLLFIRANVGAKQNFGYTMKELVKLSPLDLMPGFSREDFEKLSEPLRLRDKSEVIFESEHKRKDGSLCAVEIRLQLSLMERKPVFVAMAQDISEQKRAKEALQKSLDLLESKVRLRTAALAEANEDLRRGNEALKSFTSVASHDLQSPLRTMVSFGERLMEGEQNLSPKGKDYLSRMMNAGRRMQELLSDLLEFSMMSTTPKRLRAIDLNKVVKDVLSDLEDEITQAKADVRTTELPTIEADLTQMRQLFQNLISNALKFRKPDAPHYINISSRQVEGGRREISVQDNGVGFDMKYLDKIMKPFTRLHGKNVYEGSGIGLATCQKIIERHGGTITAKSQPGEGSVFTVTLPEKQASTD